MKKKMSFFLMIVTLYYWSNNCLGQENIKIFKPATSSKEGGHVGGGDSVICFSNDIDKNGNLNSKYLYAQYTLDYLVAFNNGTELADYSSNPEALGSIILLLQNKIPKFSTEFEKFLLSFNQSGNDLLANYRWVSKATQNIPDEQVFDLKLPNFCEDVSSHLQGFNQAIFRKSSGKYVTFYYSPRIFKNVSYKGGFEIKGLENNGTQLSWILLHEFLRNYIQDAIEIRRITELFFSKQFKAVTEDQLVNFLTSTGIEEYYLK